jgi:two-component system OmpR family response regulator
VRILVVEDFGPLRSSLAQGLREAGHAVDAASDGAEGLDYAETGVYDVVVLDVMLPKLDGFSLLETLRARGVASRVLLLTAKDAVQDRVKGLDLGADDYLVKPFALAELLARVRAMERRARDAPSSRIEVGDLTIDTASRTVSRGNVPVDLTAREYGILEVLALRAGRVVDRDEIERVIYDFESEHHSNVVDVYVSYLRKKLEAGGRPRLIHTRRGMGYVLAEEA